MTQSPSSYLTEFHQAFGLALPATPQPAPQAIAEVHQRLLEEETAEVGEAVGKQDLAAIAHELADVVYVAYSTALTYGIDLDAVIAEVHRANMTKLGRDGRPVLANGKIQKGPDYRPPHIAAVLGLD